MPVAGFITNAVGRKIPTTQWSRQFLVKWYADTDFQNISSLTYQDDLQVGTKVTIRQKPDIAIRSYTANAPVTFDNPLAANVEMDIDQALYFAVIEDKVETKESDMDNLSAWIEDGMVQMNINVETNVYSYYAQNGAAQNSGATAGVDGAYNLGTNALPVVVQRATGAGIVTPLNYLADHALVLDDQNVPREDRNIVVPFWFGTTISLSEEFIKANETGDGVTAARDRYIGKVAGFKIYQSQNLPKTATGGTGDDTVWTVFSGHKHALQFAGQLKLGEAVEREAYFDKGHKALFVFGREVTKPEGVTEGHIAQFPIS